MAATNYWGSGVKVGSHHLAEGLLRAGWQVGYISDPLSPLHWLVRAPGLRERARIYAAGGQKVGETGWSYVPMAAVVPRNVPILRTNWIARSWPELTFPHLLSVLSRNELSTVDLLYIDSPLYASLVDSIVAKKTVFRIADNPFGFAKTSRGIISMAYFLAERADVTLYSAHSLEPTVRQLHPRRARLFLNGVDFAHFAQDPPAAPHEYGAIPGRIAVYVGAIAEWFDFNLVERLTAALPEVTFVLIGGDRLARQRLSPRRNLKLLGPRPFADIPSYLHYADVGIIPFNVHDYGPLINAVNPLKLYEYMACGLPVVATRWRELEVIGGDICLADSLNDFVGGIRTAFDSSEMERQRRVEFARTYDWSRRVEELVELVACSG